MNNIYIFKQRADLLTPLAATLPFPSPLSGRYFKKELLLVPKMYSTNPKVCVSASYPPTPKLLKRASSRGAEIVPAENVRRVS